MKRSYLLYLFLLLSLSLASCKDYWASYLGTTETVVSPEQEAQKVAQANLLSKVLLLKAESEHKAAMLGAELEATKARLQMETSQKEADSKERRFPARTYRLTALGIVALTLLIGIWRGQLLLAFAGVLTGLCINGLVEIQDNIPWVSQFAPCAAVPLLAAYAFYYWRSTRVVSIMANAIETTNSVSAKDNIKADPKKAKLVEKAIRNKLKEQK